MMAKTARLPSYNIERPSYHTRPTAWALSWCDSGAGRVAEGGLDGAVDAIDAVNTVDTLLGVAIDAAEAIESRDGAFGTSVHRAVCVLHGCRLLSAPG